MLVHNALYIEHTPTPASRVPKTLVERGWFLLLGDGRLQAGRVFPGNTKD